MKEYCGSCGTELQPGAKFCGKCGKAVSGGRSDTGGFDRWRAENRMPHGVFLGEAERLVKKYTIGRYTLRKGAIDVIVTNKRVIRYEESVWLGMKTNRIGEINIDGIQGMSCNVDRSISIPGIIAVLALIALSVVFFLHLMVAVGAVPFILAVLILLNSFRPSMAFSLYGSMCLPALETRVNTLGRIFGGGGNSVVFQFKPTPATMQMLQELGACINDIRTLGDAAIEKWA